MGTLLDPLNDTCFWPLWLILNTVLKDFELDRFLCFSPKFNEKLYGAGTWFKTDAGDFNVDVQYDTTGAKKGLMDMPLFIRCAMAQKMGPASLTTAFLFGQNYLVKDNFKCKLGDNLTVTTTSCYDIKELLTNTMNAKVNIGVGAEFKI